jgi:hypothetical protein
MWMAVRTPADGRPMRATPAETLKGIQGSGLFCRWPIPLFALTYRRFRVAHFPLE